MRCSIPKPRRAFSLVELLFALAVIFVLMGLLLAGLRLATRSARSASDSSTAHSLKQATDKFIQEFGFVPALVKDDTPLAGAPGRPQVYTVANGADQAILRGDQQASAAYFGGADGRFSIYTPAYYLMGGLAATVDGKDGAGFTTPTRDGGFERKGRIFEPFFDTSRNARAIFTDNLAQGRVELRDSNNVAFRYYRWLEDATGPVAGQPINNYLNVPAVVGDPDEREELRSAKYAIVAAGPDGLFGDEMLLAPSPGGHPQYVLPEDMISRLRLKPTATNQDIMRAAAADNIVVIGGGK